MPTRILREGLLTSDRVAKLSADGERCYVRLILIVDDYGLHDARIPVLRSKLFPLVPAPVITQENIEKWLGEVVAAELGEIYEEGGKRYLWLYDTRQRLRAKEAKCPLPAALRQTDVRHPPATGGHPRTEAEAETETEAKAETRGNGVQTALLESLPDWLPKAEWQRFVAKRKELKKPLTEKGARDLLARLNRFREQGFDIAAIIRDSYENGWAGLFAKKEHKIKQPAAARSARSDEAVRAFSRRAPR